jgi:tetratricopeptide (TPR) repeat protein
MSQLFEALKKIQKKENSKPQEPLPPKPLSPRSYSKNRLWILLTSALVVLLLAGGGLLYYAHRLASPPKGISHARAIRVASGPAQQPQKVPKSPGAPAREEAARGQERLESKPLTDKKTQKAPTAVKTHQTAQLPPTPRESGALKEKGKAPATTAPPAKKAKVAKSEKGEKPPTPQEHPPLTHQLSENYKKTYLIMTANKKLEEGDLIQALNLYQRYIILDRSNAQVWNNIGAIYLRMGESKRALILLERARRLDPQDPGIQVNLAIALWEVGMKEKAQRMVDELTLRDDLNLQATYNLIALMIRMGRRKEAYNLLKRAESKLGTPTLLVSLHPYFRDLMLNQAQAGTPTAPR